MSILQRKQPIALRLVTTRLVAHFHLSRKEIPYIMADVCNKDLYDLKILEAIDYIKSVSKKKPPKERILKFMARSNLKLQEEVLQMLLDNLEEEDILENLGIDSSQCFYLKESIESYTKLKRQKLLTQEKMISKVDLFWRYIHRCQIKKSLVI